MTEEKVLVEYLYEADKVVAKLMYDPWGEPHAYVDTIKGKKIGVCVAVGASIMGWALCNKLDKYDNALALKIAMSRAKFVASLKPSELEDYYEDHVPVSMGELILKMNTRSIKYFKTPEVDAE